MQISLICVTSAFRLQKPSTNEYLNRFIKILMFIHLPDAAVQFSYLHFTAQADGTFNVHFEGDFNELAVECNRKSFTF